jgi:hypothetical protein
MRLLAAAFVPLALAGCRSGANEHFTVESKLLGRSLEQAVYVPSGDTKGRPLLVLLHGRSSSPDSMAKTSITDAVGKLGSRAPVVVFANGGDHSYYHNRADGQWGSYILDEAIQAAIRKYDPRPSPRRDRRLLNGRLRRARPRAVSALLRGRRTFSRDVAQRR